MLIIHLFIIQQVYTTNYNKKNCYEKTYVSVGELATPTMPTGKIKILMSLKNPVIEPSTQDRDTSFLESDVLLLGYRTRLQKSN